MLSFLTKQATEPIEAVGNVLDALFTSDKERLDKKAVLARIAQQPGLVQLEINKIEAAYKTVFVAGWRPFIGWVCGLALFYNFTARDLMVWALALTTADTPPPLHLDVLTTILYTLLGRAACGHLKNYRADPNNPLGFANANAYHLQSIENIK